MKDSEKVRMNPIVLDSDMSTNVIPNRITVGAICAQSVDYMKEAASKMDDAAKARDKAKSRLRRRWDICRSFRTGICPNSC